MRTSVLRKVSELTHALEDQNKAIELSPNYTEAYYCRAKIYLDLGKYDNAIDDLDHVISLEPFNAEAYFYRGQAYKLIGQYDLAITDFRKVEQISQDPVLLYEVQEQLNELGVTEQA